VGVGSPPEQPTMKTPSTNMPASVRISERIGLLASKWSIVVETNSIRENDSEMKHRPARLQGDVRILRLCRNG